MLSLTAHQALSDLLGYTSIACWLGAQFPQVVENIRSHSCEGLALPFLANWLMGDMCNLLGCILTHQLPFQTYLATYFVIVDCCLVGQYIYYSYSAPAPAPAHPRPYSATRRMSVDNRSASRYRTLSLVAGNVAKAAALAAQHDEHPSTRSRMGRSTRIRTSQDRLPNNSASRMSRESDDEVDENALAALSDSFHSEGGRHARVSWSVERHGRRGGSVGRHSVTQTAFPSALHTTDSPTAITSSDSLIRGRSLQRENEISDELAAADHPHLRSKSGRRGSSMVFLGVWALFGLSFFTRQTQPMQLFSTPAGGGRVLTARSTFFDVALGAPMEIPPVILSQPGFDSDGSSGRYTGPTYHETAEPSNERVLGRIFAWVCTTLYLTSRLPQIWKNYVRQSVQGLSMYLFIFAFLGNTFYVASILSSPMVSRPAPEYTDFIAESIPYLLGSGGTLIFDITIVAQSLIYRPKPKRASMYDRGMEEERLLDGDVLANSVESLNPAERTLSRG